MFERYTESARRVLFFARYEASEMGGRAILADHLLLALTREAKGIVCEVFATSHASLKGIRQTIEARAPFGEKLATSVEIPFGDDAKRALEFAAEEADRLGHPYIGTEHLLLGLLREDGSPAAATLAAQGLRLEDVRAEIARMTAPPTEGASGRVAELIERIDNIKHMVLQLHKTGLSASDAARQTERIMFELEALKSRLGD